MNILNEWAVNQTLDNGWNAHPFHNFLKNANQKEFLQSQIPFFFAVQSFSRALSFLAAKIEDSESRYLVIENLYEEHGHGDKNKYHTETFKVFLNALGWNGEFFKNPWITQWIDNKLLRYNKNSAEYSAYLSGIEYAYAPISNTISNHLESFVLLNEQNHYGKHAEIDWEHGSELLEVALNIKNDIDISKIKESFIQAQEDFLKLYEHIMIPTKADFKKIHQEPISFYYTRESSDIENKVLSQVLKKKDTADILMIGSGGEHLFEMLSKSNSLNLSVLDMNKNQINLCEHKIDCILDKIQYKNSQENYIGKFEQLFKLLRDYAGREGILEFYCDSHLANKNKENSKAKFAMDIIFSNENLSIVFGDSATKFTRKSFSEHFTNVFIKAAQSDDKEDSFTKNNIDNILLGKDILFSPHLDDLMATNYNKHSLKYLNCDFKDISLQEKYDIVNLSNIGDWMPIEEYKSLLMRMKEHLNQDGFIICRKLLGDYNLKYELNNLGYETTAHFDTSCFYEETIVGKKHDKN